MNSDDIKVEIVVLSVNWRFPLSLSLNKCGGATAHML